MMIMVMMMMMIMVMMVMVMMVMMVMGMMMMVMMVMEMMMMVMMVMMMMMVMMVMVIMVMMMMMIVVMMMMMIVVMMMVMVNIAAGNDGAGAAVEQEAEAGVAGRSQGTGTAGRKIAGTVQAAGPAVGHMRTSETKTYFPDKMFGGEYGSAMENRLEQELDTLEAHRARIMEANFKWRQSQMMLEYACKQLAVAVQKWQDLPTLPTIDLEIRYSLVTKTCCHQRPGDQVQHGKKDLLSPLEIRYSVVTKTCCHQRSGDQVQHGKKDLLSPLEIRYSVVTKTCCHQRPGDQVQHGKKDLLSPLEIRDLEIRYSVAADTRNNLVAAGQNLNGAQRYLDGVQFPYCGPDEVTTLNKVQGFFDPKQATEYVFTDMQSPDRHSHAQACYTTSHKRANALLQWFDTVINTTILKDLTAINDKVKEKTLELRKERVRLIKTK
ncbi:hypothetical protein FHG87_023484, partial [Trinorchestia longiramus]